MKSYLALLVLVSVANAFPFDPFRLELKTDGRIVGGEDTKIEKHPYQVSIQLYRSHYCGGSIIDPNTIMTAAHCSLRSPSEYTIRAGSTKVDSGGSEHRVVKIIRHAGYATTSRGVPVNDIALMKVDVPFELDDTRGVAKLFDQDEEAPEAVIAEITGWGRTNFGLPSILQTVRVPVVAKDKCNNAYRSYGGIPEGQICAAVPEGGKDSCQGDSGGPMTIDGRQSGIVSWGLGCGSPGYPGVYTEVASYRDWIKENSGI